MSGYSTKQTLVEDVAAAGSADFPVPGAANESIDYSKAELAVGNQVVEAGYFTVSAAAGAEGEPDTLTVTNNTETDWIVGSEVYINVPGVTLQDVTAEVQAKFDELDSQIAGLDARVAALEAAGTP